MNCKLIQTTTSDQLILHGLYFSGEKNIHKVCVIHIHGSYGNFYENFFIEEMSRKYTDNGFNLLSLSTRGRDYYADFKINKGDKYESVRIGGIKEIFQQCGLDIQAAIIFARAFGNTKIILQGHSLGAMKAIYYYSRNNKTVDGIILISPPDNFGLQYAEFRDRFEKDLDLAKVLAENDKEVLMSEGSYFDPITVESYLSLLETPQDSGMFTYTDISLMKQAGMSTINIPLLITFGTIGEAIVTPVDQCISAIRDSIPNKRLLTSKVINGANHNYHFHEKELAHQICLWLTDNF